ncbi:agarase [Lutibacter oricola]|uniref:Agarase n=1 Tax=Lutibacter oricola TaxID=762486 RepID=A0A1H3E0Q8_9FLAO|nr:T9SS type A sorting domain-containing protein [Lutibacter oricola]SDX72292.1 agarase [Lutibacter oricola]
MTRRILTFILFLNLFTFYAQTNVTVNLNVKHSVGEASTFDRSKFMVIHANSTENEWNGDNFTSDLKDHFLNGYDVYLGRDTGGITWNINQIQEDPARTGFANPTEIASRGLTTRNNFANNTDIHQYEVRKVHNVVGAQLHPFWTGESQKETGQGWKFASPTATGEYMGRYFNEFHGDNGQKVPTYIEVINEPAYEALGGKMDYSNSIQEIADFHVEVADAIRAQNSNLKIGGYTTAFPDFEVGDFQRWNNRWKLFMDVAGEKMDFWSIHLYDFGSIRGGEKELRSGSNVEATFDMMEHYSKLSFNEVKPFVISEYGAQTHDYNNETWSSYRDWLHVKASNSQLMSFLERPESIASAINFVIVKAEWGYNTDKDIPYPSRLMRKTNEPDSYTGQWVYTDMVKFFQLWQNVNGTRVDSITDDLDIQVDAYVDGDKGYVILNNLNFEATTVNLDVFDASNINVSSILKRHLTLSGGNTTVLEEETFNAAISSVEIGAESTVILEYTFDSAITINKTSKETKYYATSYLKPIVANQPNTFNINNVVKGSFGEAVLRVGVGREHGKSLHPSVKINGQTIEVPNDWRGYDQAQRERFFGVLEIPVSFGELQENNTVEVEFGDAGGHISSVSLQVFNFSDNIRVFDPLSLPSNNFEIKTIGSTCTGENNGKLEIKSVKSLNYAVTIIGDNYNKNFTFTNNLNVEGLKPGTYTVEVKIDEFPDYNARFIIEITEPEAISVSSKIDISSKSVVLKLTGNTNYIVNINGKEVETTFNEISLPLNFGINSISVKTDKECQGVFNEKLMLENSLILYPNPTEKQFSAYMPKEMIGGEISIVSMNGLLVHSQKIVDENQQVDASNLSKGVYIVKISNKSKIQLQSKLIIN